MPPFAPFMLGMTEGFSEEERRQLSSLLDRVRRNAESFAPRSLD